MRSCSSARLHSSIKLFPAGCASSIDICFCCTFIHVNLKSLRNCLLAHSSSSSLYLSSDSSLGRNHPHLGNYSRPLKVPVENLESTPTIHLDSARCSCTGSFLRRVPPFYPLANCLGRRKNEACATPIEIFGSRRRVPQHIFHVEINQVKVVRRYRVLLRTHK